MKKEYLAPYSEMYYLNTADEDNEVLKSNEEEGTIDPDDWNWD